VGRTSPSAGTKVHAGERVVLYTGASSNSTTTTTTPLVKVPDFSAQSVTAAKSSLRSLGLTPQVQQSASCTQINLVCSQDPAGGTKVHPGATVTLVTAQQAPTTTTTTQPATVAVPTVRGDAPTQACNILGQYSLVCGGQTNAFSSSVPQGNVVGTAPPAGTQVARQSTVQLVVSEGPPPTVPDFTGDTLTQAQRSAPQGVTVTNPDGTCASSSSFGPSPTITSQNPAPGAPAPADGQVTVSCASSSSTTTRPKL
jgi:serine/threonine-protein kinase